MSDDVLGLVLAKSVYHWKPEGGADPEKIFDRSGKLVECQIVSYQVDPGMSWCLLCGIATDDNKTIDGYMQLYSIERKLQQLLEGENISYLD